MLPPFFLNPFLIKFPILYPLKTPENFQFSGFFREYKMRTLARNEQKKNTQLTGFCMRETLAFNELKYSQKSKEIKQNRTEVKNFDNCFRLIFYHYYKSFNSWKKNDDYAPPSPYLDLFLTFPNFLGPYDLSCLATRRAIRILCFLC